MGGISRKGSDGDKTRSLFIVFMQNLEDLDATTACLSKILASATAAAEERRGGGDGGVPLGSSQARKPPNLAKR